jgi:predicted esterase
MALALSSLTGCGTSRPASGPADTARPRPTRSPSRLTARAGATTGPAAGTGLQPLGLDNGRDGFVFIPSAATSGEPRPLILMLHGAGGNGRAGLAPFLDRADEVGVILVGPDSRGRTWDVILSGYGPDVAFIDRALAQTFQRFSVDPGRLAVEGFSDGASYALGLGLANGDLFSSVIAFSPGFAPQGPEEGRPRIFVSHGTADDVLPIDRCSRRIVPALRRQAYDVRYEEFEGGHEVPAAITAQAMDWFRGRS